MSVRVAALSSSMASLADAVVIVFGLDDRDGDVRLVVEDVVDSLAGGALRHAPTDEDPAFARKRALRAVSDLAKSLGRRVVKVRGQAPTGLAGSSYRE